MNDTPGTRWLDADENATWLQLAEVMIRMPSALDAQLQRDSGISFYDYMVLAMLSEQDDRTLGMGQLARLTSGSLSRLSHVVKRLENQGFVTREPSTHDRRHTNAILTDAGLAKIVGAAPGHVGHVRHLVFDALSQEQSRHLREAASRIREQIDPSGDCDISPPIRRT
jgi:DNA-binding MarR family transcriptional regulator